MHKYLCFMVDFIDKRQQLKEIWRSNDKNAVPDVLKGGLLISASMLTERKLVNSNILDEKPFKLSFTFRLKAAYFISTYIGNDNNLYYFIRIDRKIPLFTRVKLFIKNFREDG